MKKTLILVFILLSSLKSFSFDGSVTIAGNNSFLKNGDTVELVVRKYSCFGVNDPFKKSYYTRAKNQRFQFHLTRQDKPQYFDLVFYNNHRRNIFNYLMMPGDSVMISENAGKYNFHGRSCGSYQLQYLLRTMQDSLQETMPLDYYNNPAYLPHLFYRLDTCTVKSLALLNKNKGLISEQLFDLLKVELKLYQADAKVRFVNSNAKKYIDSARNPYTEAYIKNGSIYNSDLNFNAKDSAALLNSCLFKDYIVYQFKVDSCQFTHRKFTEHACYRYESSKFTGALREQLVTSLLWENKRAPEHISGDIQDALTYIKNPAFKRFLEQIKATNTAGAPSANFMLESPSGKLTSLNEFKGKVVILDFWFTGCGACRDLAPILYKLEKRFQNRDVVFVSISIDKDKNRWLASLKENLYSSPLSKNVFTEGKGALHPIVKHYDVMGFPTLILIDKNGNLGANPNDPRTDGGKGLESLILKYL